MSDVEKGIFGVIKASQNYFSSLDSELSDTAKRHISKKSQDQKCELEDSKFQLQQLQERLKALEDEKFRIEGECGRINLKKSKLSYYNSEYKNEIFALQKELFELESTIGNVLTLTPREALFKHQVEDFSEESFLSVTKSHKNYQSRILVSQNELAKAEAQIQKIQEELKNETRLLENLNYQLSAAICDKKQLLNNSKKAFDEKFRNFNIRLPRRSFTYK